MTTQNFVKGVDFTGVTEITAELLNQLVDLGTVATDKGIVLVSTDTAMNTPDVPNVNNTTAWKKYIWVRIPHVNADGQTPVLYFWNDNAASDGTFLKWLTIISDYSDLEITVDDLIVDVNTNTAQIANLDVIINGQGTSSGLKGDVQTAVTQASAANTAVAEKLGTAELPAKMNEELSKTNSSSRATIKNFVDADLLGGIRSDISALKTQAGASNIPNHVVVMETTTAGSNSASVSTAVKDKSKFLRKLSTVAPVSTTLVTLSSNTVVINSAGTYEVTIHATVYFEPKNRDQKENISAQLVLEKSGNAILVGNSLFANFHYEDAPITLSDSVTGIISFEEGAIISLYSYINKYAVGDIVTGGRASNVGAPYEKYASIVLRKISDEVS